MPLIRGWRSMPNNNTNNNKKPPTPLTSFFARECFYLKLWSANAVCRQVWYLERSHGSIQNLSCTHHAQCQRFDGFDGSQSHGWSTDTPTSLILVAALCLWHCIYFVYVVDHVLLGITEKWSAVEELFVGYVGFWLGVSLWFVAFAIDFVWKQRCSVPSC